jgi:hypothetical protein
LPHQTGALTRPALYHFEAANHVKTLSTIKKTTQNPDFIVADPKKMRNTQRATPQRKIRVYPLFFY